LTALVVTSLIGSAGARLHAGQAAKVDVTGAWVFAVESTAGKTNPTATFKQDGEKLTGRYTSQLLGETELTGSVKGQAIEFSLSGSAQGVQVAVTYTGTVESKDSMKGTVSLGDLGGGTFTATRK
jgi:hypothetical protein